MLTHNDKNSLRASIMACMHKYHPAEDLSWNETFQTTWITNKNRPEPLVEFRYAFLANQFIISRVCFANRRAGCMSDIYAEICKYIELGYINSDTIVIQSVLTPEMHAWCKKHGFICQNGMEVTVHNKTFLTGDYIKHLASN